MQKGTAGYKALEEILGLNIYLTDVTVTDFVKLS